ncbi:MAG: DUF2867 domain-containing protein [Bacteroidota bacterium]
MAYSLPLPQQSALSQTSYHYSDSFAEVVSNSSPPFTVADAAKSFFTSTPPWVKALMQIRNAIVAPFGLKIDAPETSLGPEEQRNAFTAQAGDQLGIFKVYDVSEQELIMGEDDKHLDFRVSVLKDEPTEEGTRLILTTTVYFHNRWGRLYFLPVKPIHKFIVPAVLRRMVKQLEDRG